MLDELLTECPLGKQTPYITQYDSSLLFRIPREDSRLNLKLSSPLPFDGVDIWNAYELSWLDSKGKPHAAVAEIYVPCTSTYIFESKSLKMYLHSFNQTCFHSLEEVQRCMSKDLSAICDAPIEVKVKYEQNFAHDCIGRFSGKSLDEQDIKITEYRVNPSLLRIQSSENVSETVYSNLLKSNCLVTNQPDWGHVQIYYQGKKIDHASLLRYIVSYREHDEFHEQCIERIFRDILIQCKPEKLSVYGRYTRRGGIDINPYRSNCEKKPASNPRLFRQ